MSLLDQLVNFCNTSIPVSFIQSPTNNNQSPRRSSRNHSLNITTKSNNQRYSKSIDRLGTWVPSNSQQTKHRILLKLSATIKNKVRKHSYNFWVNLQHNLKEKRKKVKEDERNICMMKSGMQKLIEFNYSFQSKNLYLTSLSKGFRNIQYRSSKIQSIKHLESAIKPSITETFQQFMKTVKQREKNILKAELLISSIQMTALKSLKISFFEKLDKNKRKQNPKREEIQQILIKKSIPMSIPMHNCRSLHPKVVRQELSYETYFKQMESLVRNICKVPVDSFAENYPEISDNSYLFIERPSVVDDQNSIQTEFRIVQQGGSTPRTSIYSNSKSQKQKIHFKSYFRYEQPQAFDKNQSQKHLSRKSYQCTPKNRSIQSSSVLNIDEVRLKKLERKLFGNKGKCENRFSINGQDWKEDKKALEQIIDLIKSPPKMRRNSIFEFEAGRIQANKRVAEEENKYLKRDTSQSGKFSEKSLKIREQNLMAKKLMINDLGEHEKNKCEQKILVLLKSKKRESLTIIPGNLGKSEHWRKLYEGEKEEKVAKAAYRK